MKRFLKRNPFRRRHQAKNPAAFECAFGAGGGAIAGALALLFNEAFGASAIPHAVRTLDPERAMALGSIAYGQASLIGAVVGLSVAVILLPVEK